MKLTPGTRLRSAVTEVVVIRSPRSGIPYCGGVAMLAPADVKPVGSAPLADQTGGSRLGKAIL
jgi:hypothetical protein